MSRADLLAIPRRQWFGRLLDRCKGLPGVGGSCEKMQRVRRGRFLARIKSSGRDELIREILRHDEGRDFQSALKEWTTKPSPTVDMPPLISGNEPSCRCSVIINTVDRARDLEITLQALRAVWDESRDELIIVLGPTEDGSEEVIQQSPVPCRMIRCAEKNLAISRNLGWQAAGGSYVVFLDDDASPAEGWLDALLEPLSGDSAAGIAAGFVMDGTGSRFLNRYVVADTLGQAWSFEDADSARAKIAETGTDRAFLTATGCNVAFKKPVLEAVGGFDPFYRYFLEETDIVWRARALGFACVAAPASRVLHRLGTNLARTPSMLLDDRLVLIRSVIHYIGKFGKSTFTPCEIEACVWERVLRDLEKIAWDSVMKKGRENPCGDLQQEYLQNLTRELQERVPAALHEPACAKPSVDSH